MVRYVLQPLPKDPLPEVSPVHQSVTSSTEKTIVTNQYVTPLQIGDAKLLVEIADTAAKQTLGLSGREKLSDTQGMLFDFRNTLKGQLVFWMKDMNFDLDLIWIKNLEVVDITKNVLAPPPNTPTEKLVRYSPNSESDMVLEVRSGWSDDNKIKIGDRLFY